MFLYDDEFVVFNVDDVLFEKICVSFDNWFSYGFEGFVVEDEIGLVVYVEVGDYYCGFFGVVKSGVVVFDLKVSIVVSVVFVDGRNGGGDVIGEESCSYGIIRISFGCKVR